MLLYFDASRTHCSFTMSPCSLKKESTSLGLTNENDQFLEEADEIWTIDSTKFRHHRSHA